MTKSPHRGEIQRARAERGAASLEQTIARFGRSNADGATQSARAWGDVVFRAGEIVSSPGDTYFLIDDMRGRLIARGFSESDTYRALVGRYDPRYVPDAAFGVLDGYEVIQPGSCLVATYGSDTIWFVDGGRARGITSTEAFRQYHFDRGENDSNIQVWPKSALDALANDPELYIRVSDRASAPWRDPSPKKHASFRFESSYVGQESDENGGHLVRYYKIDEKFSINGIVDSVTIKTTGSTNDRTAYLTIGALQQRVSNRVEEGFRGQSGQTIMVTCRNYWVTSEPLSGELDVDYWANS